jgi:hypothetical protein
VRRAKTEGRPPETILVALKDVVRSAARESGASTGPPPRSAPPVTSARRARVLEQVVRWCIEEYYS